MYAALAVAVAAIHELFTTTAFCVHYDEDGEGGVVWFAHPDDEAEPL